MDRVTGYDEPRIARRDICAGLTRSGVDWRTRSELFDRIGHNVDDYPEARVLVALAAMELYVDLEGDS